MNATDFFQVGQIDQAVNAAIADVKEKPGDANRRWFLCEMLCFTGDLTRVDKHLDAIFAMDAAALPGVSLFRQLVRAESARQQFFAEGKLPDFLSQPDPDFQKRLQASIYFRENALTDAAASLVAAENERPAISGTADGKPFDDFRDVDDLAASFLEVFTSTGKYYWIPLARVRSIDFRPPSRARDLLWRAADVDVADGPHGEVFIPALYPGSQAASDPKARLGRATEWNGPEGATRGIGQRMFLIGDQIVAIGDLKQLTFNSATPQK